MNGVLNELKKFVVLQIANICPDGYDCELSISTSLSAAYARTEYCISKIKAWSKGTFDRLVSGQYAIFLYFLSNEVWRSTSDVGSATRIFLLNKALNGIDLFFELRLPDVFFLSHTSGIVLAKASYGSHLVLHQGCTVGRKGTSERPVIEDKVVLFPGSMVIGSSHIRARTILAPGVILLNEDSPGDCYVFSDRGGNVFKPAKREVWRDYFVDQ